MQSPLWLGDRGRARRPPASRATRSRGPSAGPWSSDGPWAKTPCWWWTGPDVHRNRDRRRHRADGRTRASGGLELTIALRLRATSTLGESVAVDGACLTVAAHGTGRFTVQVVRTSLERTRFGDLRTGQPGEPGARPPGRATASAATWSRVTWTGSGPSLRVERRGRRPAARPRGAARSGPGLGPAGLDHGGRREPHRERRCRPRARSRSP